MVGCSGLRRYGVCPLVVPVVPPSARFMYHEHRGSIHVTIITGNEPCPDNPVRHVVMLIRRGIYIEYGFKVPVHPTFLRGGATRPCRRCSPSAHRATRGPRRNLTTRCARSSRARWRPKAWWTSSPPRDCESRTSRSCPKNSSPKCAACHNEIWP